MITVKSIRNVKYQDYDAVFAIVRKMKPNPNIIQVDALSPSLHLFYSYRDLEESGTWDHKAFADFYVPRFLKEMAEDKHHVNDWLNYICQLDKAGKKIALCCFCTDETMCHRSIIAGLLQGVGRNVVTETGNDYSFYYDAYKALREQVKTEAKEEFEDIER